MKILIAVPTFENIYPDTFKSIYGLDSAGHEVFFDYIRGYDVATARNKIAQAAIDEGADYVLMVDNDVVLPEDVLVNMTGDIFLHCQVKRQASHTICRQNDILHCLKRSRLAFCLQIYKINM